VSHFSRKSPLLSPQNHETLRNSCFSFAFPSTEEVSWHLEWTFMADFFNTLFKFEVRHLPSNSVEVAFNNEILVGMHVEASAIQEIANSIFDQYV
jgi:hypothetical protein